MAPPSHFDATSHRAERLRWRGPFALADIHTPHTTAKITKMFETSDDAQLDRMVQAPDHFPYVIGPEYTWKDNLVVFAAVVCGEGLAANFPLFLPPFLLGQLINYAVKSDLCLATVAQVLLKQSACVGRGRLALRASCMIC
jgi:hypothetical protein